MIVYLSPQQVLFIHARLIATTGGSHGVRDLGLMESAVFQPQVTFEGQDLYPTLYLKAAALLASLIRNHPFIDGNKRTAITASSMMLRQNGVKLTAINKELERFVLEVIIERKTIETIAKWLKENSRVI